jgi:cytochrome b pre-mRNA-processing protein 3
MQRAPAHVSILTLAKDVLLSTFGHISQLSPSLEMFTRFKNNPVQHAAERAYRRVVEQARRPGFFTDGGIPDTIDGRFELICLHAFLYLHRMKAGQPQATTLGQRFFDTMFADFDRALREMGTGDLSVGREIRRMAEGFYGRVAAYERGLAADDAALQAALARNLFGTAAPSAAHLGAMAGYVRREAAYLTGQNMAGLLAGEVAFGPPPGAGAATPPAVAAQ